MNRLTRLAMALVVAAILPAAAHAQSLPFRAGQWGAEFQSGDLTTAGVMRFFTPSTAVVVDVGILDIAVDEETPNTTVENSTSLWAARLGFRNYRPLTTRVAGFWTAGLEYARASQEQFVPGPFGGRVEESETHIGPFGQLGADYHVTNNLAVGVALDVTWAKISGESKDPGGTTDISGHRFTASFTPVRVSLFF